MKIDLTCSLERSSTAALYTSPFVSACAVYPFVALTSLHTKAHANFGAQELRGSRNVLLFLLSGDVLRYEYTIPISGAKMWDGSGMVGRVGEGGGEGGEGGISVVRRGQGFCY